MKDARKVEGVSIVDAVIQLLESKNIDRQDFQEVVESAFISVLKKRFDSEESFYVTFNLDKGDIEIYREWEVVEDGAVENDHLEIELTNARKLDPEVEVGEEVVEIIDYRKFGRRTILNLKQALMHKIREIEKNSVYEEYKDRIGEVIHAEVHQVDKHKGVILNIDHVEFRMPPSEMIKSEKIHRSSSLRALIKDVRRENNRDPEIIVSRADPNFIRRLFEVEVPEIADGIIRISKIARVPGRRTKIAVESTDPRIDPVGSCVGMKGQRIQAIVNEVGKEKIDIIDFAADPVSLIKKAMSPNKPLKVILQGSERALVVLSDEEYRGMIERQQKRHELRGDTGEFVFDPADDMVFRLAAEITGYDLTLASESDHLSMELTTEAEDEDLGIMDVVGIPDTITGKFIEAGVYHAERLLDEPIALLIEKTGLPEEEVRSARRCVSAYFQDFKVADVVDLPRAYKDILIGAGYAHVEDFLNDPASTAMERTGLTSEDMEAVMLVLGDFDNQAQD